MSLLSEAPVLVYLRVWVWVLMWVTHEQGLYGVKGQGLVLVITEGTKSMTPLYRLLSGYGGTGMASSTAFYFHSVSCSG
jgi:hypothetical protein